MFSGRIFSNTVNKSSEIPSLESFLDSNLSYEIRDIDSTLIEQAINVSVLHTQATYFYLKEHNEIILESGLNDFLNNAKEFFIKLKNVILDFVKKTVSYIQSYTGSFDKFLSIFAPNGSSPEYLGSYHGIPSFDTKFIIENCTVDYDKLPLLAGVVKLKNVKFKMYFNNWESKIKGELHLKNCESELPPILTGLSVFKKS